MAKASKQSPAVAAHQIFILEDHPVFREGLAQIVGGEKDLDVCGTAGSAAEAFSKIALNKPDLILVDLGLPGKSGLEFIKEIRTSDRTIKLLVISMHDEALYANRVLRAGGDGYIMKQENPEEIVHAIRDVLGGHIYVSEEVMANGAKESSIKPPKAKARPLDSLTDTELEILESLGKGKSNQEIARQIRSNARTVATHCARIRRKLKLKTDNAVIRYAVCWVESGKA